MWIARGDQLQDPGVAGVRRRLVAGIHRASPRAGSCSKEKIHGPPPESATALTILRSEMSLAEEGSVLMSKSTSATFLRNGFPQ